MSQPDLTIVIPVYNEADNLHQLYLRLQKVLPQLGLDYEIIAVDDGSNDKSLDVLEDLRRLDEHLKIIALSRNFGHQAALTAGMDYASGRACITLDADLQHPPEIIPALVQKWKEGYDVVYTIRNQTEKGGLFKKASSTLFYKFINVVGKIDMPANSADFRLVDRKVLNELITLRERSRFIRGLVSWVGFKQIGIDYTAAARFSGQSKYSIRQMMLLALAGIFSFSSFPLYLAAYFGLAAAALSFIYAVYVVYMRLFAEQVVSGWSSITFAILFLGGIQLIFIGIIGAYLGRLYDEVKQRPLYIVERREGVKDAGQSRSEANVLR